MKFLSLNEELRSIFGERVQRIPLNAGFLCPNRLSSKGACIFCDDTGSSAPWLTQGMTLKEQFLKGKELASKRYKAKKYIAYFQSYTATSAPIEELKRIYYEALSFEGVVGLAIATRPDCISDEVLNLLDELNKKTHLWVELGAQSMNEKSLLWMNRGHTAQVFVDSVTKLRSRGIKVIGHIIFGLPTETIQETIGSFKSFINTGINGYKIHALHIIKNTVLEDIYKLEHFKLLSLDEYVKLVRTALSLTPKELVIHRLTGEVDAKKLIAPLWVLDKQEVLRRILE